MGDAVVGELVENMNLTSFLSGFFWTTDAPEVVGLDTLDTSRCSLLSVLFTSPDGNFTNTVFGKLKKI